MKSELNDEQVQEVLNWLNGLREDLDSQYELAQILGLSQSSISRVLSGGDRPGRVYYRQMERWHEEQAVIANHEIVDDAEPDDKPEPESVVDTLAEVEELVWCAIQKLRDTKKFRPLLRPGVERLRQTLEDAKAMLEFGT